MSKRFIDTGIFDDEWFMNLSKDAKLLWIYFITKCDHAGIIKINEKLCKVQTDIKDLNEIIKQLSNRLITVNEHLYFIPKFIEFQYPGFPKSKVRQQDSALEILNKYGLITEGKLTVAKLLPNSYEHDNGTGTDIVNVIDYENVVEIYHSLCPKMNKVAVINEQRKGFIKARFGEFGQEKVIEVLRRAGQSDFLNGLNPKAWKADFEWILRPNNFIKVMEGKYDNKDLSLINMDEQEKRIKELVEMSKQ